MMAFLAVSFQAMDILTPLGRGMNFLVVGPRDSGKTCVGIDAILAQKSTGEAPQGSQPGPLRAQQGICASHGSVAAQVEACCRCVSLVACTVTVPDVKCVYVSIGRSDEELQTTLEVLKAHKVVGNTAVVSAPPGASVGESLAAIHAACSIGGKAGQVEVIFI